MWISIALLACTMAPEVRWVPGSGDHLREVAGYRVESYRDAGLGGLDWTVTGDGPSAGWEHHQLWLYDAPLEATTDLAVASDAVAFMMDGDRNDGWATFLVDGQEVGSFDMYGRRNQTLVVEGLSLRRHTLTVRVDGIKRPRARAAHVALYGGSALVRDVYVGRQAPGGLARVQTNSASSFDALGL